MIRHITLTAIVIGLIGAQAAGVHAQRGVGQAGPQAALRTDLDGMTARLGGRGTPQQAIADAQRLATGYRSLGPHVRGFGPNDYAVNREMARRSLYWLSRANIMYAGDPLAARAFLDAYDSIGLFYRDYGYFYSPGAYVAYASATRLAQRLARVGVQGDWYARELQRYALAYGALAVHDGQLVGRWGVPQDLPDGAPTKADAGAPLKPLELPRMDITKMTPEQREAWTDVRDRFRSVASKVHGARILMDQLAGRLNAQGLALHPEDAANALKMQGFLDDAVDLIQAGELESATDSLRAADAERTKLRGVTGQ
jgi:hypothetical protein